MRVRECAHAVFAVQGPCIALAPHFGVVKRAMNRSPGPSDWWWAQHAATCGGSYVKVREPAGYRDKKEKRGTKRPRAGGAAAAAGGAGTSGAGSGAGAAAAVTAATAAEGGAGGGGGGAASAGSRGGDTDEAARKRRHEEARRRTLDAWLKRAGDAAAAPAPAGPAGARPAPSPLPCAACDGDEVVELDDGDVVELFDTSSDSECASHDAPSESDAGGGTPGTGRCPVCVATFPAGALAAHVDDCVVLCD